jgi:hypothetical protein
MMTEEILVVSDILLKASNKDLIKMSKGNGKELYRLRKLKRELEALVN